jgi:hypothetical protein
MRLASGLLGLDLDNIDTQELKKQLNEFFEVMRMYDVP